MIINFPEIDPADRAVGLRVRKWREKRGMSLAELAAALHLTRSEMIRAEDGRAHLSATQLYAATLHLHIPMRLLFEDYEMR
ncbi:helix-turn-helix domain-containing protein [Beijerinckia indica]|uniref:Transcriptional regulator, XRE family n=1 Tax=Beijerinckia indica subsp. indica (strain ATCC 9039 / DSM 1715 / NCIMB 8712) TaxID=395963 RepID=B2IG46_BEII9|nr:helix-turn-helix domain-containing protein [Beijerinckia indica]ACB97120.1 transcriptional regulator, XRE family [Beijerinckia indica subsp. indica ATCC 9039]